MGNKPTREADKPVPFDQVAKYLQQMPQSVSSDDPQLEVKLNEIRYGKDKHEYAEYPVEPKWNRPVPSIGESTDPPVSMNDLIDYLQDDKPSSGTIAQMPE